MVVPDVVVEAVLGHGLAQVRQDPGRVGDGLLVPPRLELVTEGVQVRVGPDPRIAEQVPGPAGGLPGPPGSRRSSTAVRSSDGDRPRCRRSRRRRPGRRGVRRRAEPRKRTWVTTPEDEGPGRTGRAGRAVAAATRGRAPGTRRGGAGSRGRAPDPRRSPCGRRAGRGRRLSRLRRAPCGGAPRRRGGPDGRRGGRRSARRRADWDPRTRGASPLATTLAAAVAVGVTVAGVSPVPEASPEVLPETSPGAAAGTPKSTRAKPGTVRFIAMNSSRTPSMAPYASRGGVAASRSETRSAYRSRLRRARAATIARLLPKKR